MSSMPETITITMPSAPEERAEILSFLEKKGLVPFSKPGKYAELAKQYREEKLLDGHGAEVQKLRKAFREDFALDV